MKVKGMREHRTDGTNDRRDYFRLEISDFKAISFPVDGMGAIAVPADGQGKAKG